MLEFLSFYWSLQEITVSKSNLSYFSICDGKLQITSIKTWLKLALAVHGDTS